MRINMTDLQRDILHLKRRLAEIERRHHRKVTKSHNSGLQNEERQVEQRIPQEEFKREHSWRKHNIFHTRCTAKGKVCNLNIDGDSCENMVSTYMVGKLSLPTEKHLQPYSMTWLETGIEAYVDKRCLVEFSIGGQLQEQVWCDVVPMDECHILLGRPWQNDRKAHHDEVQNTYSFLKQGKRFILLPFKEVEERNTQSSREIVGSHTTCLQAVQEAPEDLTLVVFDKTKAVESIPYLQEDEPQRSSGLVVPITTPTQIVYDAPGDMILGSFVENDTAEVKIREAWDRLHSVSSTRQSKLMGPEILLYVGDEDPQEIWRQCRELKATFNVVHLTSYYADPEASTDDVEAPPTPGE